jgi:hypothetical protein
MPDSDARGTMLKISESEHQTGERQVNNKAKDKK